MPTSRKTLVVLLALWVAAVAAVTLGGRSEPDLSSARPDPGRTELVADLGPRLDSTIAVLSTTTTLPVSPPTTRGPEPEVHLIPPVTIERPSGECGGWADLIAAHFPPEQIGTACRVMLCESRGDPGIANEAGSGASGLWQFTAGTWAATTGLPPPAAAYSPDQQTAAAAQLWATSGWGPWSCAT